MDAGPEPGQGQMYLDRLDERIALDPIEGTAAKDRNREVGQPILQARPTR